MFSWFERARTYYLSQPRPIFEAMTLGLALLVGLIVMPALIYLVGRYSLGPYGHGTALDANALLRELAASLPSAARLREAAGYDAEAIARAAGLFIEANARLARALRSAEGRIRFPDAPERFDSPIGAVVIGTRGDDRHRADAALIVDPAGNDAYERAPTTAGAVSVIVDLGGDDRYRGSDLVAHGLAAILDFAGEDAYESEGPAWAAAFAGVSLLVDYREKAAASPIAAAPQRAAISVSDSTLDDQPAAKK